jgi:hypothetical protein
MIAEGPLRGSLVPKRFWNMDETIVYFESRTTSSVELKGMCVRLQIFSPASSVKTA